MPSGHEVSQKGPNLKRPPGHVKQLVADTAQVSHEESHARSSGQSCGSTKRGGWAGSLARAQEAVLTLAGPVRVPRIESGGAGGSADVGGGSVLPERAQRDALVALQVAVVGANQATTAGHTPLQVSHVLSQSTTDSGAMRLRRSDVPTHKLLPASTNVSLGQSPTHCESSWSR